MTPDEAQALAERTLAAIDAKRSRPRSPHRARLDADRERVTSDLAGLRDHREHGAIPGRCARCQRTFQWPCHDAARYVDGLRRTARLYGVEVQL